MRDHRDFDDWMADMPPSHREAAKAMPTALFDHRRPQMRLVEGMLEDLECQEIGNLIQTAIGTKMAKEESLTGADLPQVAVKVTEDYQRAVEVLRTVESDLAGKQGLAYHSYLMQYAGPWDKGRRPASERKAITISGMDPRLIDRVWVLAVNHDGEFAGGELYFPTLQTVIALQRGAALVFSPDLPYGIAPVRLGIRRMFMGWSRRRMA